MIASNLQARRATVDDLPTLRKLWQENGLAVAALEKQLTEFQIVETVEGKMLGAVALRIDGTQGQLHDEAFSRAEQADELRLLLWNRVRAIARNHGLHRIWTNERAPFWSSSGFESPSADLLKMLPTALSDTGTTWLVLKLRDEIGRAHV